MKTVCEVLGVARSAVAVKRARSSDWRDGRRARVTNDAGLVEEIQAHVAHLPTYGYRRVWALLRRSREQSGAPSHGFPVLTIALRMVSSLRMQATSATFFGLPAATRRS